MKKQAEEKGSNKRKWYRIYLPVIIVIALVAVAGYYWYKNYTRYISTDDAYVNADRVSVSAKVLGRITHLYFDEGDSVQKGDLVVALDSTDLVAQKMQSKAQIEQAKAAMIQAKARLDYDKESTRIQEINLEKATEDFKRAEEQYKGNVIPKEQYDHIKKAYQSAQAQLDAARTQLKVAKAQVGSAQATVESAIAQKGVIETQLTNMRLYSPSEGVIAKRWLLPGDVVQPGQSIFTIYNDHKFWIDVNLEETKLANVYLDQRAKYSIDAFPDEEFYGKVYYIGSNTASQFSLIPPNNASGNFTKITQRVPLKISIDKTESGKPLEDYNFLAGMSVVVKIIKD